MNPVVAIYGCFERWNIFASDKNDRSPVSPLVRSREWAKSEFNVGHSRIAVGILRSIDSIADELEPLLTGRPDPAREDFRVYDPGTD
jgi:hypothetical protein